jgi:hypothetical protein
MCRHETLFNCIHVPWLTTMVSSVATIHIHVYLLSSHQLSYLLTWKDTTYIHSVLIYLQFLHTYECDYVYTCWVNKFSWLLKWWNWPWQADFVISCLPILIYNPLELILWPITYLSIMMGHGIAYSTKGM